MNANTRQTGVEKSIMPRRCLFGTNWPKSEGGIFDFINKKLLTKLRSIKTALMQDLLTGKMRVTPLLTESQEVSA